MGSKTFSYNNGVGQKMTVPNGVKILEFVIRGASSGNDPGGRVTGRLRVNGGDVIWVNCGQSGRPRSGPSDRTGGGPAEGGGGPGGNGTGDANGGNGGGGATVVRLNSWDGRILAVAGGAGGTSGDGFGGNGGSGGANIGGPGERAHAGGGNVAAATGGTQNQGGRGGTSSLGTGWYGGDATGGKLGRGGRGGQKMNGSNITGGGGGGGGYYPGGGGQAGRLGGTPSGGGAGGSNYVGDLYNATTQRGNGTLGHGEVVVTWEDPGGNEPPVPPVDITINGVPIADGLATRAVDSVLLRGIPNDPDHEQGVRMLVRMTGDNDWSNYRTFLGTYDAVEKRDKVELTGLRQDKRYYLRLYTQDNKGKISTNFRSTNFWTNRKPLPPTPIEPAENVEVTTLMNVTFSWTPNDPDDPDPSTGFQIIYRRAGTPATPAGDWILEPARIQPGSSWVMDAGTFKGHTFYEWVVRTRDGRGAWSEVSEPQSFYVEATSQPPLLLDPVGQSGVPMDSTEPFRWRFRSPTGEVQTSADFQWRAAGTETWTVVPGTPSMPGPNPFWAVNVGDNHIDMDWFVEGFLYEWQVRTTATGGQPSDWSDSGYFYAVAAPGSGAGLDLVGSGRPAAPLGQGNNRAFVFERGGKRMLGEITNLSLIRWNRQRDDISGVTLVVNEWDKEGLQFLRNLRTWMHEIVVFRDNGEEVDRVWEGPITRISGSRNRLELEAKDVMGYVYRRIMRQGYNDAFRRINGIQVGQKTVVQRSAQIVMNCLAYDDPNVLAYLTPLYDTYDARTSRVVKDYTKTAWEELDDLAAHAGLDYVTSGRRIILWDTHRAIGRLPEMRDGDFSDPPIVTEYGMNGANVFGVTNNNGVYGVVTKGLENGIPPHGFLEQLASSYGQDAVGGTTDSLTRAQREALERNLRAQAARNIAGRWPPPLVVRVPDNTTISPDVNITINQFIPGVWIPLRAEGGVREVSQWQKLDTLTVEQTDEGEKVTVIMSPAPQAGMDPDADEAAIEGD